MSVHIGLVADPFFYGFFEWIVQNHVRSILDQHVKGVRITDVKVDETSGDDESLEIQEKIKSSLGIVSEAYKGMGAAENLSRRSSH